MKSAYEGVQVSVITSLYRCSVFLESFLQHYSRIVNLDECELILIHNDPTDEELAIISNGTNHLKKVVHIKVNREGLYASWNRGIKYSKGKYIAIWNVDDIRTPDSILQQKLSLESGEAFLAYGDFYGTRRYGEFKEQFYQYRHYENFRKEIFRRHIIGCFPMWRKELHDKIGYFDEQFRLAGDFEFQLRVAVQYPLVKTDYTLGYYLQYASHKLGSNKILQHRERTAIQIRYQIYDRVLIHFLPFISKFRLGYVKNFGDWIQLTQMIPRNANHHTPLANGLIKMFIYYSFWFLRRTAQSFAQLALRVGNKHSI